MHLFGSEGEFFFFFSFSRERDALDPALPTEAPRGPCSAEESDRLKQSLCKKYKNTTKNYVAKNNFIPKFGQKKQQQIILVNRSVSRSVEYLHYLLKKRGMLPSTFPK